MQGNTSFAKAGTLASVLENLIAGSSTSTAHLQWPPNVFAICAYLLKLSGTYFEVLSKWPPASPQNTSKQKQSSWEEWICKEGFKWSSSATLPNGKPPKSAQMLWSHIGNVMNQPLVKVAKNRTVTEALIQLVALSDAACVGVGIPQSASSKKNPLRDRAFEFLAGLGTGGENNSTLSPEVNQSLIRVLPKQHTPRSGLTLRSLTHHLALHVGGEVEPVWQTVPKKDPGNRLNLLVAPWPLTIRPSQFQPSNQTAVNLPKKFGYVEFLPAKNPKKVANWTKSLISEAKRVGGRVDGVIFPEAALSEKEYNMVRKIVLDNKAFLIAGVLKEDKKRVPQEKGKRGSSLKARPLQSNFVIFDSADLKQPIHIEQMKHHRWRLDRGQIEMYGLGGTLDSDWNWWENIAVGPRKVYFITLSQQLSVCCLACEDLARQDPVSDLVRSVGPNLVITLLMDAPQLKVRWPARYATVLADDPGSSVLTVTSAGMVDLTRTPQHGKPSRSVGLWKDARSDSVELELPHEASGLLLNLCTELVEEWTADGRSDRGTTGYPRLGGVHPIRLK